MLIEEIRLTYRSVGTEPWWESWCSSDNLLLCDRHFRSSLRRWFGIDIATVETIWLQIHTRPAADRIPVVAVGEYIQLHDRKRRTRMTYGWERLAKQYGLEGKTVYVEVWYDDSKS